MAVTHDVRDQIEKIDEQIVDLLAQRVSIFQEAMEESDGVPPESELEAVTQWEAMAEERAWSMTAMANISRWIVKLCKSGGE